MLKKIICVALSARLLVSSTAIVSLAKELKAEPAEEPGKASVEEPKKASAEELAEKIAKASGGDVYPFIFVHGMGAWGSYEKFNDIMPNWGGWGFKKDSDITKIFTKNGIPAYAASVGPFSSAWDRACELYAELTGTVVDYGEAHSKAHNHERYGFSYENNRLMEEPWDLKSKLNFVGHSFGAATVRLLASLLAFGDRDEINATGEETSPLFKGGHGDAVNAVVSLAGPHNGTPISGNSKARATLDSFGFALLGTVFGNNFLMWSFQLSQFGITPKQGERLYYINFKNVSNFGKTTDRSSYDLTIKGAAELNEKIKLVPTAYYYSYVARATKTNSKDDEVPIDTMFALFKSSSRKIGKMDGETVDGLKLDKSWEINDGLVPYASAVYPIDDKDTAKSYEEAVNNNERIEPGRWYYMPVMEGFDHFDFSGTRDYPTSFEDFYFSMADVVNNPGK